MIGGGSTPDQSLPTFLIAITSRRHSAAEIEGRLRGSRTGAPVIARVERNRLIVDLRTVFPDEEFALVEAISSALRSAGCQPAFLCAVAIEPIRGRCSERVSSFARFTYEAPLRKSKTPAGTPAVRSAFVPRADRATVKTPAGSLRYGAENPLYAGSVVNPEPSRRLITEATQPAPKPLSIFTTLTLQAQLLSMPSNAATPWKLAP